MARNLLIALWLLLPAPLFAQGFPAQSPTTDFKIVDGRTHRPIEGAEIVYQCGDGGGNWPSAADGTVSIPLYGATACEFHVHFKGYQPLDRNWKSSEPRTFELAPADAAHPGWVDPSENGVAEQEMVPAEQTSSFPQQPAQPVATWQEMVRTWLEALLAALLPAIAFFVLREISVRATLLLMMRKGGGDTAPPAEPEAAPADPPPPPVETIEINTLNGLLLQGPSQARLERALDTHRDKYRLVALSVVPQLFGLAAAVYFGGGGAMFVAPILLAAFDAIFLWFLLSLYLQGKRVAEAAALVGLLGAAGFAVIGRVVDIPLTVGILPVLLQGLFLAAGFHRIRRAARADGSRMLVVLRVFNADRNAAFVFGPLMALWRFLGPYVTVSDPSYVRYAFTIFQRANITRTIGTTLTIALAVFLANHLDALAKEIGVMLPPWLDGEKHKDLLKGLVYAAIAVAAILPSILYLWRRFLKRPDQAVAQVDRAAGAGLGVESDYRGGALFCFDDVWKPAVGRMLEVADLVLMDLRGFSAERQGCAYELGQLIDHFPVDRLLILVDAATPRDLLTRLIGARWAAMAPASPNRAAGPKLIRLYQTGDREKRDIRNILALLSMSLEGPVSIRPGGFAAAGAG